MDKNSLPKSRAAAKAQGSLHYFTGKPCKRGHVDFRLTSSGQCHECARISGKASRLRRADKINAYAATYRNENKEKVAAVGKRWREANPERSKQKTVEWREANPDRVKEYRAANKDLAALYTRTRRTRKLENGGTHTIEEIENLLRLQKYKCAECQASVKDRTTRHVDHIMPVSKGGRNDISNLQILCATCNHEKWAIDPFEFARRKGRLL